MRHFSAPCRLLDFTYSFYIALYFAIEKMDFQLKKYSKCAIFALSMDLFRITKLIRRKNINNACTVIKNLVTASKISDKKIYNFIFRNKDKEPFVFHISPYILNKRITIQQGTFLCPWDIDKSFEQNLVGNLQINKREDEYNFIKKIIIKINK